MRRKKRGLLKWFVAGVFLLLAGLLVFLLRTKFWNRDGKLAVVVDGGEDVIISLYDAGAGSRTDVVIPGKTQVLAAYGLGTWKLESLWKLGTDEKTGGSLITRSVAKNFGLPVFVWWDALSTGDKIRIKLFGLFNRNGKDAIYLRETGYLKKAVFVDGEEGYVVNKDTPEKISSLFSDQEEFGSLLKAKITDSTGSFGLANRVGKIIETMGIKVAAISKGDDFDFDCRVTGKNKKLTGRVALILGCGRNEIQSSIPFDLEIDLGEKFAQGFLSSSSPRSEDVMGKDDVFLDFFDF